MPASLTRKDLVRLSAITDGAFGTFAARGQLPMLTEEAFNLKRSDVFERRQEGGWRRFTAMDAFLMAAAVALSEGNSGFAQSGFPDAAKIIGNFKSWIWDEWHMIAMGVNEPAYHVWGGYVWFATGGGSVIGSWSQLAEKLYSSADLADGTPKSVVLVNLTLVAKAMKQRAADAGISGLDDFFAGNPDA